MDSQHATKRQAPDHRPHSVEPACAAHGGKRLAICFYTDVFFPSTGGAQTVLDQIVRQVTAVGHTAVVVAPSARGAWTDAQLPYPVVRYRRPWSKRFGVRMILARLATLHWRQPFDVLHCHAAYPQAFVAATFRRLFQVPYVVRPHGDDILPGERIRQSHRLERRMRGALAAADAVIAQGRFLRDVILDVGVSPTRIHTIHNGVQLEAAPDSAPRPHQRPYILALGNLVPHKGFDLLLRAYALLPRVGVDLLIVGLGPEELRLRALAQQLGIAPDVQFLGQVTGSRKHSLYGCSEYFVCPSRREPFANVILEALAAGRPVVATAVGGNTELIRDGINGLLSRPEDAPSLAAQMTRLLSDRELRMRLQAGATDTVRQYDWRYIAQQYLRLYESLAAPAARNLSPNWSRPPQAA